MIDANSGKAFEVQQHGRWFPVIAWDDAGYPMVMDLTVCKLIRAVPATSLREVVRYSGLPFEVPPDRSR